MKFMDKRHIEMIELMVSGEYKMQEIADLIGVARNTLYTWLARDDVKKKMEERLQEIKTNASKLFDSKLDKAIDLYWKLATDPKTDKRTKQIALSYWIDRSLGKISSRVEIENKSDSKIDKDDVLTALDNIDNDEDDKEYNDKIINIAK